MQKKDRDIVAKIIGKLLKKELEFARYLSDNNIPVWIRQVIIHGSMFAYQPVVPKGLEKFEKKC